MVRQVSVATQLGIGYHLDEEVNVFFMFRLQPNWESATIGRTDVSRRHRFRLQPNWESATIHPRGFDFRTLFRLQPNWESATIRCATDNKAMGAQASREL